MSFWSELRRRKVVRVGVAYLVVALAVAEGADIFLPQLGAPAWVVPVVLGLLVLGFPLASVLAWAYDITPEGLVRDGAKAEAPESADVPVPEASASRPRADGRRSVAVLPLTNMSGDPENEFFGDGMTEDILTHLSRVKSLRVTSRTSVMQYKGTTKTVREIAEQLGVESVLEGSIRVAGGKVRVTVQLIDAAADDHLWAETYDRSLEDVFAVQSEVAQSVAKALQAELSPSEVARIRARPTNSIEAYTLCLRGEETMSTWQPADLAAATRHFQAALRLDPHYARPRAGLALILAIGPAFTGRTHPNWHEELDSAARGSLEQDEEQAMAHAALGTVLWSRDFDWAGAEAEFKRAIELEPESLLVRGSMAFLLIILERFDEAMVVWEGAEAGPREDILVRASSALALYNSGRAAEAVAVLQTGLSQAPDSSMLLYHQGTALFYLNRGEEAEQSLTQAIAIDPDNALALAVRAVVRSRLGWTEKADEDIQRLRGWTGSEPVGPFLLAYVHLALDDVEGAIALWQQSVAQGDFFAPFLRCTPRFRPLRAHPRFQALLQHMWPDHGPFEVDGAH
jgi:TolB-like protein/Flp pilus assembly protein TadD